MTTMLMETEPRKMKLPANLRQPTDERALIELALEAVQAVGERWPQMPGGDGRHCPQMLLTLLTYCYAAGVYGSEDIEYACRHNAAIRYLCANAFPDQQAIRTFRRANRPRIEDCLTFVYCSAREMVPTQMSRGRTDLASFVRRRLELAIQMDMAMSD